MVDYDPANQNATGAGVLTVLGGKPSIADLKDAIAASDVSEKYPTAFMMSATKNDLIFVCRTEGIEVPGLPGVADYTVAAPVITVQPSADSVEELTEASFSVTATGTAPLQYQWEVQLLGAGDWAEVAGADEATYAFDTVFEDDTNEYRCRVFNAGGSVTSNAAVLTVTEAP